MPRFNLLLALVPGPRKVVSRILVSTWVDDPSRTEVTSNWYDVPKSPLTVFHAGIEVKASKLFFSLLKASSE